MDAQIYTESGKDLESTPHCFPVLDLDEKR